MNNFQITITAVDKATASVRKIRESMARVTRPYANLRKSMGNLAREIGLPQVGKSFKKIGQHAGEAARRIGRIAAPMAAITGIGSVAGIAALATSWGKLGYSLSITARTIGVNTSQLQALRGAAELAGVSSQSLTSGLASLGKTLEDARYGRNPAALMLLDRMGIQMHRLANGAPDTVRGLMDISRAIQHNHNVQAQAKIASAFGLSALLPLLRQGPRAIAAYEAKARSLNYVMGNSAVASAARFGMSMNLLRMSFQGLRNAISVKLLPVIQPMIDALTHWIAKNRELIATSITRTVKHLAAALAQVHWAKVVRDIGAFFSGLNRTVKALGGWKTVLIGIAALKLMPAASGILQLASGIVMLKTALAGLSAADAARGASVLNGLGTSVARPSFMSGAALGGGMLGMWWAHEKTEMREHPNRFKPKSGFLKKIASTDFYGNPVHPAAASVASASPAEPSAHPAAAGAAGTPQHSVQVEVSFINAPPGVTATARTRAGDLVPTRVCYAMSPLAAS